LAEAFWVATRGHEDTIEEPDDAGIHQVDQQRQPIRSLAIGELNDHLVDGPISSTHICRFCRELDGSVGALQVTTYGDGELDLAMFEGGSSGLLNQSGHR